MLAAVDKYLEWNQKAVKQKVKLDKEIDYFGGQVSFKTAAGTKGTVNVTFYTRFFSQSPSRHQFLIRISSIKTDSYNTIEINQIYLDYDQVSKLRKAFDIKSHRKNFTKIIKERVKKATDFQ